MNWQKLFHCVPNPKLQDGVPFFSIFFTPFPPEWRTLWRIHRRCRTESRAKPRRPPVSCPTLPGPPGDGVTWTSLQGDGGRQRGRGDGGPATGSCSGRLSAAGCLANVSTWRPLARRATRRKALLRGLHCRATAGPPCHYRGSVARD